MGYEFEAISGKIIDAAMAVHKALGPGFVEPVYQKAVEVALQKRGIPFERQLRILVHFEGVEVGL